VACTGAITRGTAGRAARGLPLPPCGPKPGGARAADCSATRLTPEGSCTMGKGSEALLAR
jgi:hypothetical protein